MPTRPSGDVDSNIKLSQDWGEAVLLALVVSGLKDKPEAVRDLLQKTNLGKLKALLP
jgi:hypothetical protein